MRAVSAAISPDAEQALPLPPTNQPRASAPGSAAGVLRWRSFCSNHAMAWGKGAAPWRAGSAVPRMLRAHRRMAGVSRASMRCEMLLSIRCECFCRCPVKCFYRCAVNGRHRSPVPRRAPARQSAYSAHRRTSVHIPPPPAAPSATPDVSESPAEPAPPAPLHACGSG